MPCTDGLEDAPHRAVDGALLFAANRGDTGYELWRSDGTEQGTSLVTEIAPGPTSSSPCNFVSFRDRVVFGADDGAAGTEPWAGPASILLNRPRQAIDALRHDVLARNLPRGTSNSLVAKLAAAARSSNRGPLVAFINAVGAQRGKRISEDDADALTTFAREILRLLQD